MRKATLITGLVLLALSGYVIVTAMGFPPSPDQSPGPGVFPILVAIALAVLVLLLLWENRGNPDTRPIVDIKSPDFHRVLLVVGALVAYAVAMPLLGFLVATPLALFGTMLLLNRQGLVMKLVATVVTTGVLYGTFHTLLQVPLP